jgi:hypothetical protein
LKKASIGCPETSVTNYQSLLCKIPEDGGSHLHHSKSLKSCMAPVLNGHNAFIFWDGKIVLTLKMGML